MLSAFFSWCMRMGLTELNPVIGTVQQKPSPARDRVLSDAELAAIWNAADGSDDFSRIVRLLILLPCRRQEVGGMAWSELDLDAGTWAIPAARAKNRRGIVLPLMPMALEIIRSVPRRATRDQLFGALHAGGFSSWDRAKKPLYGKLAIAAWNLHDLRRSVATRMADLGVAPHVIEQLLNHQSGHKAASPGSTIARPTSARCAPRWPCGATTCGPWSRVGAENFEFWRRQRLAGYGAVDNSADRRT